MMKDKPTVSQLITQLIPLIDENSTREGLERTPERFEKFMHEFLKPGDFNMTIFDNEGYDEMIIQTNISFYSMCEHHLAPFFGSGTIAYIPDQKIVGLSKLSRVLEHFSRRLQNQERITTQVADYINDTLQPKGVGVVLNARHLCMEMRGVKKSGTSTTTSCVRGLFKTDAKTRMEFMDFATRSCRPIA